MLKALIIVVLGFACMAGYFSLKHAWPRTEPGGEDVSRSAQTPVEHRLKPITARPKRAKTRLIDQSLPEIDEASRYLRPSTVHEPSAIPIYREDVQIPRFPHASDLNAGANGLEVLRKFGGPDLYVVTSVSGKYEERFIYFSINTGKATSVQLQDGKVIDSETHYSSKLPISGVAGVDR